MTNLDDLYQIIILEHNRQPQNFGSMAAPDGVGYGHNANCGDVVVVQIKLEGERIAEVRFSGEGCAICRASASLLTLNVRHLSKDEGRRFAESIIALLTHEDQQAPDDLGDLAALLGVRRFPMRIKCATLAWHAFLMALDQSGRPEVSSDVSPVLGKRGS